MRSHLISSEVDMVQSCTSHHGQNHQFYQKSKTKPTPFLHRPKVFVRPAADASLICLDKMMQLFDTLPESGMCYSQLKRRIMSHALHHFCLGHRRQALFESIMTGPSVSGRRVCRRHSSTSRNLTAVLLASARLFHAAADATGLSVSEAS